MIFSTCIGITTGKSCTHFMRTLRKAQVRMTVFHHEDDDPKCARYWFDYWRHTRPPRLSRNRRFHTQAMFLLKDLEKPTDEGQKLNRRLDLLYIQFGCVRMSYDAFREAVVSQWRGLFTTRRGYDKTAGRRRLPGAATSCIPKPRRWPTIAAQ